MQCNTVHFSLAYLRVNAMISISSNSFFVFCPHCHLQVLLFILLPLKYFISCKKIYHWNISTVVLRSVYGLGVQVLMGERTVWDMYGYKEVPYFLCFCSIEGRNPSLTPRTPILFCLDEQLFYKCMLSNHSFFFEAIDYFSSHIHWAQDLFVCWSTWSPHSEQLLSVKRLINKNA